MSGDGTHRNWIVWADVEADKFRHDSLLYSACMRMFTATSKDSRRFYHAVRDFLKFAINQAEFVKGFFLILLLLLLLSDLNWSIFTFFSSGIKMLLYEREVQVI